MKVIDNKGKLFGLINIIDLAVITIFLLLIGAAYYKLSNGEAPQEALPETEVVTVVRYEPETESELKAVKKGDQLIADNRLWPVFVEKVEIRPEKVLLNKDGRAEAKNHPFKKEMFITLKGRADATSLDITMANQIVKVGRTFIVKTLTAELSGTISEVQP